MAGRRLSRLARKRIQWVLLAPVIAGDVHYDRWPCPHAWKNCRCLGDLTKKGR